MAFRRFNSSARRSFSSFRRPKANTLWTFSTNAITEVNGVVNTVQLVTPSMWVRNTTAGGRERCKVLRLEWMVLASSLDDLAQARSYAMSVYSNDATDVTNSPTGATYWTEVPGFAWGGLTFPPLGETAGFTGNRDYLRVRKVNRVMDSTQSLWLTVEAGTTGNLLAYTVVARTLLQLRS